MFFLLKKKSSFSHMWFWVGKLNSLFRALIFWGVFWEFNNITWYLLLQYLLCFQLFENCPNGFFTQKKVLLFDVWYFFSITAMKMFKVGTYIRTWKLSVVHSSKCFSMNDENCCKFQQNLMSPHLKSKLLKLPWRL